MRFRTIAENDLADQDLADQGVAYVCSPPDVLRIAAAFHSAARAGLRHVDGLLIDPLTHRPGDRRGRCARADRLGGARLPARRTNR